MKFITNGSIPAGSSRLVRRSLRKPSGTGLLACRGLLPHAAGIGIGLIRAILLSSLLWTAGAGSAQVTIQDLIKADSSNWFNYSGSYGSQRHSALKQIDAGNVGTLAPKWIYHLIGPGHLEAVPIQANGVMYVPQANEVNALDARTGRLIWQYQRGPANGNNRGLAISGNKVYMGTADAAVVALDARTGGVVWETKMPGPSVRYQGGAPLVVKDKVIIGAIIPAGGTVDAYDAETGKFLWRWNAVPKPGEPGNETWTGDSWKLGGVPTWLTGSYDPESNLVYWGTGQPAPDFDGTVRPGDNLYSDCMVALDPDTGKMKWYFQFTPHDVHDWDAVEVPVLVDTVYEGQPRKLMLQANRNGYYYILDRTNGKFLHGSAFVKSINWTDGLTPEGRPIVVPGREPTVLGNKVCPSTMGATNWPSPAYDPDTHYFYFIAFEGCGVNYKATDKLQIGNGPVGSGTGYVESPNEQEQWQAYVRALDATTGKLVWEYKQIGSHHYGPGVMSTAGGLVFAADMQGYLTAHDARTGKPLWHFSTGDIITASPMAYSVQGNEYVAIVSGSNVVVFGLPDRGGSAR
jgi:alcohol dehydrogenase (cytochrome c)